MTEEARSDIILTRMMALHPKIIDLTLGRVERLLAALGHPERRLPPVIHVAGTNGKGSTQAMIRAGLNGAGQTCHAYTSPHLVRFHERIRLADSLIDEDLLTEVLARCEAANGDTPITYFEITTCAALLAFAECPADYVLLEVGLGGRLDATNVIEHPTATVITPVALDHQHFLGDTLDAIAFEKAGILKRGAPAIIARQDDAAMDVIETRARDVGAPLSVAGQDWTVWQEHGRLAFQDNDVLMDLPLPALAGDHQIENAGTALACLRLLGVDETACAAAMRNVTWPARLQRLRTGRLSELAPTAEIWLDGGHNPAAGEALAHALRAMRPRPTVIVCGMLNTKDVRGFLKPLGPLAEQFRAVSVPDTAATLSAEQLAEVAGTLGLPVQIAPSIERAVADAPEGARILICGSVYFAGAVLRANGTALS